jgi:uncharacterized protein YraI
MLKPVLILAALLLATPALAEPTARATAELSIYAGPGPGFARIGTLYHGARVELAECTRNERWCRLRDGGWVDATYLVGMAAKIRATPPRLLGFGDWDSRFWSRRGRNNCGGFPYDPGC